MCVLRDQYSWEVVVRASIFQVAGYFSTVVWVVVNYIFLLNQLYFPINI